MEKDTNHKAIPVAGVKTALVVGGTDGVGLSIVRALAEQDYSVFFIGRSVEKGQLIQNELRAVTSSHIEFIELDLSDVGAVREFSLSFLTRITSLDVLAFSAGVIYPKRQQSVQGLEKMFATGYLSAFVLSQALRPALKKGRNPRVTFVCGGGSIVLKERLDFDDLNSEKNYSSFSNAANTVHAKAVLADILAEKFRADRIDVNAFHPGIVRSSLTRNLPWPINVLSSLPMKLISAQSKTGVKVNLSAELNGVTGCFFEGSKRKPIQFSDAYKKELWAKTEALLSTVD